MITKKIVYNVVLDKKERNGRGEFMIKISASLSGRRVLFPTNIYVYDYQFEDELVIKHEQAKQLNAMINKNIMDMQQLELEAFRNDIDITIQTLCSMYVEHVTKDTPLIDFNDHVMKYCTNRREMTKRKYYDTVKLINEFHPNVCLEDIDIVWLKKYEKHMYDKGNQQSTVQANMKVIRALFNEAIKRDILKPSQNPFKLYQIQEIRSRDDVLMFSEIEELELYGFKSSIYRNARDIFCFACYTGLRWHDLRNLKNDNIKKTGDITWLKVKTHKTGAIVQIPISIIFFGNALRILEKYNGVEDMVKYQSNASINRCIRELLGECDIGGNQRITMHTARRSFITALADFGTPISTIQKLAGHARITTTSKYLQLSIGMIKKDVEKAFDENGIGITTIHIDTPKREVVRKSLSGKDLVIGSEIMRCRNCCFFEANTCRLFHKKKVNDDWCDSFFERLDGEPYHFTKCKTLKKRDDVHTSLSKRYAKKRVENKCEKVNDNTFKLTEIEIINNREEFKEEVMYIVDKVKEESDELVLALSECE